MSSQLKWLKIKCFTPPLQTHTFDIYIRYRNTQKYISDQVLFIIFYVVADLWYPLFIQSEKRASALGLFLCITKLNMPKIVYVHNYHMPSLLSLHSGSLHRFRFWVGRIKIEFLGFFKGGRYSCCILLQSSSSRLLWTSATRYISVDS